MNPVLILTRNNLELTKKCVESVLSQDIPTEFLILDNDSTDGTVAWMNEQQRANAFSGRSGLLYKSPQVGVSAGWNIGIDWIFKTRQMLGNPVENILVLNNDAIIPPWFYRRLLNYDQPFITGVAIDTMPTEKPVHCPLTPNPDFSAFLIRRDAWERIGQFDESMVIYCSDCDYHIRGHQLGVPMLKANVPYYHINSQTLKRADPADREAIQAQANKDREVFRQKWGCLPGTPEYQELFK